MADHVSRFVYASYQEHVGTRIFENFTAQADPHLATHSEVAKPLGLGMTLEPPNHKRQDLETPSTLMNSQGIDPLPHAHAEVMAPCFEQNPYDGYSTYDFFPAQNTETRTPRIYSSTESQRNQPFPIDESSTEHIRFSRSLN